MSDVEDAVEKIETAMKCADAFARNEDDVIGLSRALAYRDRLLVEHAPAIIEALRSAWAENERLRQKATSRALDTLAAFDAPLVDVETMAALRAEIARLRHERWRMESRALELDRECIASMAEIANLRRALDAALAALEPFADIGVDEGVEDLSDDTPAVLTIGSRLVHYTLTLGDFRRARAALQEPDNAA